MDEHALTTNEVRTVWADWDTARRFDAWLAETIRRARGEGWEACAAALVYEDGTRVELSENRNPYRSAAGGAA